MKKLPPWAISFDSTLYNKTGSWRNFRPVYENKLPPCNDACPAGEQIQGYIDLLNNNQYRQAWELLTKNNPLPATCGRVCFHPCETACNRATYDEAIAVHNIERFIGDYGLSHKLSFKRPAKRKSKKVAIVGGGPAGLSCAYQLALMGYRPTILEASSRLGGLLTNAIPSYRLPKRVAQAEIDRIVRLGVNVKTNFRLGRNESFAGLTCEYDAIFIATGAYIERKLGIAGEDNHNVIPALEFLDMLARGRKPKLGREIAVIGGGNAAMDAARSLLRMGKDPLIIYRRTKGEMPAIPDEIHEAEEEKIPFLFLTAPVKILTKGSKITGLECIRMKLGPVDKSGRRSPVPIKGSNFKVKLDGIITAIGEMAETSFLPPGVLNDGWIRADGNGMTVVNGVFVGGDALTGPRTVVEAIGAGKRAAFAINEYLVKGKLNQPQPKTTKPVAFEELNTAYFEVAPRMDMQKLPVNKRTSSFDEVLQGYKDETLHKESTRCFSCGVCNKCDNCFIFCPDMAVLKKKSGYEFNYDYCKGCGVCVTECPRRAISLVEEKR
ncbi:MAG: NAD(P)-binding protein [Candidatus Brocadiia bacterium]